MVCVKIVFSEGQNGTSVMCLDRAVIIGIEQVTRVIVSNVISI